MTQRGAGVVGIVPAAGYARRLGDPDRSKELIPVRPPETPGGEPEPVCHTVLRALARARVPRAIVVIRRGKEDIAAHLGTGEGFGLSLDYVALEESPSPVHSIAAALELAGDAVVALGFADVLYDPPDPFTPMLDRLGGGEADVVLGLFPPTTDYATERVDVGDDGAVARIDPRPPDADGRPTWTLAVWRPAFSRLLAECALAPGGETFPASSPDDGVATSAHELTVGAVVQLAIDGGMGVEGVRVSDTPFLDIGDPKRLEEARRRIARHDPS